MVQNESKLAKSPQKIGNTTTWPSNHRENDENDDNPWHFYGDISGQSQR
jgi:hypothetical protein